MLVSDFITADNNPIVLCLGGFDSMHKGHAAIIKTAVDCKKQGENVAVTLFVNEGEVFERKNGEVFSFSERLDILEKLSVNEAIRIVFNKNFSMLSPVEFLDKIFDNRPVSRLICGPDFKFGSGGSGNADFLKEYCKQKGSDFSVVPFVTDEKGDKISTTSVKKALSMGDVKRCEEEYGVKYFIKGEIIHGREEGRKMGFPTANILPEKDKFPLKSGVYACTVTVNGTNYRAISNLGDAPTFGVKNRILECHIDGFSGDLYGKTLSVFFDDRIRDIVRFSGEKQLKEQLEKDLRVIR